MICSRVSLKQGSREGAFWLRQIHHRREIGVLQEYPIVRRVHPQILKQESKRLASGEVKQSLPLGIQARVCVLLLVVLMD